MIKCNVSLGWADCVHCGCFFHITTALIFTKKDTVLSILKTDCGHAINAIQWEGMEVILCHFPDEGLPFSLAPDIRSERSKRRLLWNLSVGVEDLCGHALWTNKILCYHKPLRSKRRLSPNHVLSWSYLIMCNLSNFLLWQHRLKKINSA